MLADLAVDSLYAGRAWRKVGLASDADHRGRACRGALDVTHPKAGEWWCPGRFTGRDETGDTYSGCDGDEKCKVCHGESLERALERRVNHETWAERERGTWRMRSLRGWANLMASRYGRPVYLCGGALKDDCPRDIDVRVVLSATEFDARFGEWRNFAHNQTSFDAPDKGRRWHLEIAKMNKNGASHTHLPIDFQVQPLPDAMRYMNERRERLDDVPEIKPPWED